MKQFPTSLQQLGNVQRTGRAKPFVLPPFLMHSSHFFSTVLLVLCYFASFFLNKACLFPSGNYGPPPSHFSYFSTPVGQLLLSAQAVAVFAGTQF